MKKFDKSGKNGKFCEKFEKWANLDNLEIYFVPHELKNGNI